MSCKFIYLDNSIVSRHNTNLDRSYRYNLIDYTHMTMRHSGYIYHRDYLYRASLVQFIGVCCYLPAITGFLDLLCSVTRMNSVKTKSVVT